MTWFVREAEARGWRAVVFNRRGNGTPLTTPQFNLLGSVDDTILQVEHVHSRYPQAFLAMVGLSAGSGLLVNYLGKERHTTPVRAACSLCPGYDLASVFGTLRQASPLLDGMHCARGCVLAG